ncbi:MAG: hypothetical protein AB1758_34660, partial [Candidatus Eremiobacterota bacterium]
VSATVKQDGFLTLAVEATDPDGDPLSLQWTTSAVTPAGKPGRYSAEGRAEMEWDPAAGRWRQEWEWRPPPGAAPGTRYLLTATVSDGRGGTCSDEVGATGTVEVLIPGRIAFVSNRGGSDDLYTMNPDGTDVTRVTQGTGPSSVGWAPDGARICFARAQVDGDLYVVERDGSGMTRVTDRAALGLGLCEGPVFSGDGAMIAFLGYKSGDYGADVYLTHLDGTDPRNRAVSGAWRLTYNLLEATYQWTGIWRGIAAHPDGQRLLIDGGTTPWPTMSHTHPGYPYPHHGSTDYGTRVAGPSDVYELLYRDVPSPVLTNLTDRNTPRNQVDLTPDGQRLVWGPEWWTYSAPPGAPGSVVSGGSIGITGEASYVKISPDGNQVVYGRAPGEVYSADLDGGNERNLSNHPATDYACVWSPR